MNKVRVVLATGGFDPIHSGHIQYFEKAKELGDILVVGLNSDAWLTRKKGKSFMPWVERSRIVKAIKPVGYVFEFNDDDNSSKDAIKSVRKMWPNAEIIFVNGGDRTQDNIPEMDTDDKNIRFEFGVGGENKKNSSSWILEEWKSPKTMKDWGKYHVLYELSDTKVKELVIQPGKELSLQKHDKRNEYWFVSEGQCNVHGLTSNQNSVLIKTLKKHEIHHVPEKEWHKISNPYGDQCKIVEIQYGTECSEEDIERRYE